MRGTALHLPVVAHSYGLRFTDSSRYGFTRYTRFTCSPVCAFTHTRFAPFSFLFSAFFQHAFTPPPLRTHLALIFTSRFTWTGTTVTLLDGCLSTPHILYAFILQFLYGTHYFGFKFFRLHSAHLVTRRSLPRLTPRFRLVLGCYGPVGCGLDLWFSRTVFPGCTRTHGLPGSFYTRLVRGIPQILFALVHASRFTHSSHLTLCAFHALTGLVSFWLLQRAHTRVLRRFTHVCFHIVVIHNLDGLRFCIFAAPLYIFLVRCGCYARVWFTFSLPCLVWIAYAPATTCCLHASSPPFCILPFTALSFDTTWFVASRAHSLPFRAFGLLQTTVLFFPPSHAVCGAYTPLTAGRTPQLPLHLSHTVGSRFTVARLFPLQFAFIFPRPTQSLNRAARAPLQFPCVLILPDFARLRAQLPPRTLHAAGSHAVTAPSFHIVTTCTPLHLRSLVGSRIAFGCWMPG